MEYLSAIFEFSLNTYLFYKGIKEKQTAFTTVLNGFDVVIELPIGDRLMQKAGEEDWICLIMGVKITVGRKETEEAPPDFTTDEKGMKVFPARVPYFDERLEEYSNIAVEAINRLLRYFKYQLNHPFIHEYKSSDREFRNPIWMDETKKILKEGHRMFVVQAIPGVTQWESSVKKFTVDMIPDVRQSITNPISINLYDEFMSDAQASIFNNKLRRATIEIAVACEIAVKQAFYGRESNTAAVIDYLEDRGKLKVKVLELIDGCASDIFGKSFREVNRPSFEKIDYLFRCRNKVAHRGELLFRDDKGVQHEADRKTLEEWWIASKELIRWLGTLP